MLSSAERGESFEVRGVVMLVTNKSVLLFDDRTGREVFLPHTRIKEWEFSDGEDSFGMSSKLLERDDRVNIQIPKWLAEKEGLM